MGGRIKVGRWLPFSARQVLNPHRGFVWTGRAAGVIAGSDHYVDGAGALEWTVARLVTVASGAGQDVLRHRSMAGRRVLPVRDPGARDAERRLTRCRWADRFGSKVPRLCAQVLSEPDPGPDRLQKNGRPAMTKTNAHSTVLVGIDGSQDGLRAVDYAADEALRTGAHLMLAHVVPQPPSDFALSDRTQEALLQAGERAVESARQRAEAAGIPGDRVGVRVWHGAVTSTLAKASRLANLVVLGRRGISGLERMFSGSTSTAVGARAQCPVVVVPHAWSPDKHTGRVTVGLDGSARSLPALAAAVAEATWRSAELVAVHAWQLPPPYYVDMPDVEHTLDKWRRTAELAVAEELAGWAERHPDIAISRIFEHAHPVGALVEHSADSDLLVVGTRGGGGIHGLALGSVARAVVAGSVCPVMLVRRGPRTLPGVRKHRTQHRSTRGDLVAPTF
jgi:nucleotide-binding universal stress UspA family protein